MNSAVGALAGSHPRQAAGIPRGYAQVDPRNPARSRQVFLGQPLSDNAPTFPGDPPFRWQLWNCVNAHPSIPRCRHGSGYTLEQIQSLGTPFPDFRALVSCQSIGAGNRATITNISTGDFAANTAGDSTINAQVSLLRPCIAPIVFVTGPTGTDVWFAATGN
jgi:hypothetical protein